MVKKKRFLFILFLTLTVCLSTIIPTFAKEKFSVTKEHSQIPTLSKLSDNELLLFLEENKVVIPTGFADSQTQALEIIRSFIIDIEQNPNIEFIYGLSQLYEFAYALKSAVNDYYGISTNSILSSYASHGLQDSTVYQTPSNMGNYNCYAYALGRI